MLSIKQLVNSLCIFSLLALFFNSILLSIEESIDLKYIFEVDRLFYKTQMECMSSETSKYGQFSHPKAPIQFLPPRDEILHWTSRGYEICDPSVKHLRVLLILTTGGKIDLRHLLRQRYSEFEKRSSGPFSNPWTLLFVVARPETRELEKGLAWENHVHKDILVVNVKESYFNYLTLKMLVAFKFVGCFCPNAEYLIKTDDDNYILMNRLDETITQEQTKVNLDIAKGHLTSKDIYLGWSPKVRAVERSGPWGVTFEEYKMRHYPPYNAGQVCASLIQNN